MPEKVFSGTDAETYYEFWSKQLLVARTRALLMREITLNCIRLHFISVTYDEMLTKKYYVTKIINRKSLIQAKQTTFIFCYLW